jgi:hypothetical protein
MDTRKLRIVKPPLPTAIHLELLAQYEKDVAQMLNVR